MRGGSVATSWAVDIVPARLAGETRTPMVVTLLAHRPPGLPVGHVLAFPGGLGVLGLWVGLVLAGLVQLGVWSSRTRPSPPDEPHGPIPEVAPSPSRIRPSTDLGARASRPLDGDGD